MAEWQRQIPGFRSGKRWKRSVASIGYALIALFILAGIGAGRPSALLLGAAALAIVLLVTNAWGLRARTPVLNSRNRLTAGLGWSGLALMVFAALGSMAPPTPRPEATLVASPVAQPQPTATSAALTAPTTSVVSLATPTPSTATNPSPTDTPVPATATSELPTPTPVLPTPVPLTPTSAPPTPLPPTATAVPPTAVPSTAVPKVALSAATPPPKPAIPTPVPTAPSIAPPKPTPPPAKPAPPAKPTATADLAARAISANLGVQSQNRGCPDSHPIKGNLEGRQEGREADPIYHVRDQSRNYAQTVPEVCFATVSDAERAGFRPPR